MNKCTVNEVKFNSISLSEINTDTVFKTLSLEATQNLTYTLKKYVFPKIKMEAFHNLQSSSKLLSGKWVIYEHNNHEQY